MLAMNREKSSLCFLVYFDFNPYSRYYNYQINCNNLDFDKKNYCQKKLIVLYLYWQDSSVG